MQTLELFCGTKSFSNVAAARGWKTFTVDIDAAHQPDLAQDIRLLGPLDLPRNIDILWASPPCNAFSVAAIGRNWNADGSPKPSVHLGLELVAKTMAIICEVRPRWWFIENPRAMLRTVHAFEDVVRDAGGIRRTITYCQYGDTRQKPTDVWTNATWWRPRPRCFPGAACHEAASRGSKAGTQRISTAKERARIPAPLFQEIFSQLSQEVSRV